MPGVDLGVILHGKDLLLPERRVVIKAQLGVSGQQVALVVLGERVDLQEQQEARS